MWSFQLLNAVGQVRQAVQVNPELPPLPDIHSLNLGKCVCTNGSVRRYRGAVTIINVLMHSKSLFSESTPSNYFVDKGTFLGLFNTSIERHSMSNSVTWKRVNGESVNSLVFHNIGKLRQKSCDESGNCPNFIQMITFFHHFIWLLRFQKVIHQDKS